MTYMKKIKIFFLILFFLNSNLFANENTDFEKWKKDFKQRALANNISEKTFDLVMTDTKFLANVIKYDRYQPEFYEDTKTYISKRSSTKKLNKGIDFYLNNKDLINIVENKFKIEKELLLSLMGIETNYGTYVGKMDILSSLATLSDFNTDNYIDLKNSHDAYASAANYLKKIGWKKDSPCFYRIDLKEDIPKKYLNVSAKKLQNKKKLGFFKKYIDNYDDISFLKSNYNVAIITPDKDIIPGADTLNPAYIVFDNYEIILQWNRSLRFALAVCTLKDKFKNEL